MAITNQSKPTTSVTNQTKVSIGESWDTNITSWNTETRSWNDMFSFIDNQSRQTSTITNVNKP